MGKKKPPRRSEDLTPKFTDEEREAYMWLYDCGIRPWVVDLLTKRVRTATRDYKSLVEFAKSKGWKSVKG